MTTTQTTIKPDMTNPESAVVVRYNSPTDFYWVGLGCWGHFASISKVVAGTAQEIAFTGTASQIAVDTPYNLKVTVIGNKIQLFVNNVLTVEATDAQFSSGGIGFRLFNSHAQFAFVDVVTPSTPMNWLPFIGLIAVGAVVYMGTKK